MKTTWATLVLVGAILAIGPAAALAKTEVMVGGGQAMLKTASGGALWIMLNGESNVVIKDEAGNVAHISTYDVNQSNGVIHVIDRVALPK